MDHAARVRKVGQRLEREGIDAALITYLPNIRYLTGFTGSNAFVIVDRQGAWFLTDGRYKTQSAEEVSGAEMDFYLASSELGARLGERASAIGAKTIAFEAARIAVAQRDDFAGFFEGAELVATTNWVEDLRRVKDPEEIAIIREAARMADEGLAHILEKVSPGKTERDLALDLEFFMRRSGADDVSFDLIVAAAERSALPHAHPSDREVEKGHFLLFDLGCIYKGYCSDLTRTVVVGQPDERRREVYETVLAAQAAGLAAIRPGVKGGDVDAAARSTLAEAGLGEAFSHGTGHGVGLEIHELPNFKMESEDVLVAGDVVTVEPGAYIAGWGGVRIEDLVLVTEDGHEVLSQSSKDLLIL
jgi:Xaa-Pro aminopeptidase